MPDTRTSTTHRMTTKRKPPMPACSTSTSWKTLSRSGAIVVVFGLGLASSGLSYAANGGASTVRAVIGGDGKVSSISRLGGDSNAKPNAADLPVTLGISKSGGTVSYAVANTTGKTEDVTVTEANGTTKTVQQQIQTPYVAQLHVTLPSSLTDVSAPGAAVVTHSDGSHQLTWSLVLFAPIGSPTTTVSYTAKGSGNPVAQLEAIAVSPTGTPGLSATGQAANATVQGNGTLSAFAAGASDGLTQLSAGVGQIIAGLEKLKSGADQLHTGLAAGSDGTRQLADGLHAAHHGSGDLADGLAQIKDGTGKLSAGTGALHTGSGQLVAGLQQASDGSIKLVDGSQDLATGAGLTAKGAQDLSDGLQLISGGLVQLGSSAGLPAAKVGALALKAGVDQISAGLGSPTATGTILNGLAGLGVGLTSVKGGLDQLAAPTTGLPAAKAGVDTLKGVIDNQVVPGLGQPTVPGATVRYGVNAVRSGLAAASTTGGSLDQLQGAVQALAPAIATAAGGPCAFPFPAPPTPPTNACETLATVYYGIGQVKTSSASGAAALQAAGDGLTSIADVAMPAVSNGLGAVSAGLGTAIAGVNALVAGVGTPTSGPTTIRGGLALVNAGTQSVALGVKSGDPAHPGLSEGLDALITGLTSAISGVSQLSAGATSAATGSIALADGTKQVADGAGKLSEEGAVPISDGLAALLAGGTKLDAGAGQLDTGAKQLDAGVAKAAAGSKALDAGIGKISAGEDQVAAGLPAAVSGSGQIADGAGALLDGNKKVAAGLKDAKGKAVDIIGSQLGTGTENAKVVLAELDAAGARLTADPAVATTTYVLTQEAGDVTAVKVPGGSHVARNIGLGAGGAVLLLGGLATGFVSGRRRVTV